MTTISRSRASGDVYRVLVVDDHAVVREGVKRIISEAAGFTVGGEAGSVAEALAALRAAPHDVALVDLGLPDGAGLQLIEHIARLYPRLRILVLSVHAEEAYAARALRAGAHGYLKKDSAPRELVAVLEKVTRGERYVRPPVLGQLAGVVAGGAVLSPREHDVLCALAAGETLTGIGAKLRLSVKTVSTYRARLLKKLGVSTNAELIRYALVHRLIE